MKSLTVLLLVLVLGTHVSAFEKRAYIMADDFGTDLAYDCYLNYYYYVPCPTFAWFWGFSGWAPGDKIGAFFQVGDMSMFSGSACDPRNCHSLVGIRVLDFAGYGTVYPGRFSVEFDVYCSDGQGCPVGPALWSSGPLETGFGWNHIPVEPALHLSDCSADSGFSPAYPAILITATMVGTEGGYPQWGFDNISSAAAAGYELSDYSRLAALYPRPYSSHYGTIHTGYYGPGFTHCPPIWFCDGRDSGSDCGRHGFIEVAWRIYLDCSGPRHTGPDALGGIESTDR